MPKFFNRNCAVVYVDDSEDDHFLFQYAVSRSETPLHVQPFFSADPAFAFLSGAHPFEDRRTHPFPSFLLCDYDLKISSGPQLVAAVRSLPSCSTLPIIMFSNSDNNDCILQSYLAGANYYLCKPTMPERLDTLVRSLYDCAMLSPRTFKAITALHEHRPRPVPARSNLLGTMTGNFAARKRS